MVIFHSYVSLPEGNSNGLPWFSFPFSLQFHGGPMMIIGYTWLTTAFQYGSINIPISNDLYNPIKKPYLQTHSNTIRHSLIFFVMNRSHKKFHDLPMISGVFFHHHAGSHPPTKISMIFPRSSHDLYHYFPMISSLSHYFTMIFPWFPHQTYPAFPSQVTWSRFHLDVWIRPYQNVWRPLRSASCRCSNPWSHELNKPGMFGYTEVVWRWGWNLILFGDGNQLEHVLIIISIYIYIWQS